MTEKQLRQRLARALAAAGDDWRSILKAADQVERRQRQPYPDDLESEASVGRLKAAVAALNGRNDKLTRSLREAKTMLIHLSNYHRRKNERDDIEGVIQRATKALAAGQRRTKPKPPEPEEEPETSFLDGPPRGKYMF